MPWCFVVLLTLSSMAGGVTSQSCVPSQCPAIDQYAMFPPGNSSVTPDFYIGGLFSVRSPGTTLAQCGPVMNAGLQNLEAFLWAVSTFKSRYPTRLTGFNIGALGFDSCGSAEKAMQQVLNLESCQVVYGSPSVDPGNVLGYIGPDSNTQAAVIAPILGDMQKTVISQAATTTTVQGIPYFLRTVASDIDQVTAIVAMLKQQRLSYTQVVYSADLYGQTMWQELEKQTQMANICIVNSQQIPTNFNNTVMDNVARSLLRHQQTKVVVLLMDDATAKEVLLASNRVTTLNAFNWVGTNSWGENTQLTEGLAVSGSVTFSLDGSATSFLPDLSSYLEGLLSTRTTMAVENNPWLAEYLSTANNGSFAVDGSVPFTLLGVDAMLIGIDNAITQICGSQSAAFCSSLQSNKWPVIYDNIRKVQIADQLRFDQVTGNQLLGRQSINVIQANNQYVKLGSYYNGLLTLSTDLGITSTCGSTPCTVCGESAITTTTTTTASQSTTTSSTGINGPTSQSPRDGPPSQLREGDWIIVLLVLAAIGVCLVIAFEIYLSYKMTGKTFISSMWLGQMLLFALFLSFLSLFAFVPSPTQVSCGIVRFTVGICYAMIFSVFLVKLMIIFSSKSVGFLKGIFQLLMFIFAWGVQIAIDVQWLIMRPPDVIPVYANVSTATGPVLLIDHWVCSQSFTSNVITLSYVMFLIVICTFLSFKAHGIVTNHRESVYIGICSFLSILIFLAWILLGFLHANKEFEDACLSFGLLVVAYVVLLTMYIPKVRQLRGMSEKGVYLDDDTPDYTTPSIIPGSLQAGSLINGTNHYSQPIEKPIIYKVADEPLPPVVYLDDIDGNIYSEAKIHRLHVDSNPDALYLKHPGSMTTLPQRIPVARDNSFRSNTASVRSVPVGANARILRRSGDLSGRGPVVEKAQSEIHVSTVRPAHSPAYIASTAPRRYDTASLPRSYVASTIPRGTGTARSVISTRSVHSGGGTLPRTRSLHAVGSL